MQRALYGLGFGLVVVGGVALVIWFGASSLGADNTPKPIPARFVWGGNVPLTKPMLRNWLHDRGVSYATWAKRHPAAAKRLDK